MVKGSCKNHVLGRIYSYVLDVASTKISSDSLSPQHETRAFLTNSPVFFIAFLFKIRYTSGNILPGGEKNGRKCKQSKQA